MKKEPSHCEENVDSDQQQLEKTFAEKARHRLDQKIADMDTSTLARLNDIRHIALDSKPQSLWQRSPWLTFGGIGGSAAVVSLMLVFMVLNPLPYSDTSNLVNVRDTFLSDQVLANAEISDEDIAMLDDIEFIAWLMEQDEANAG